MFKYGPTNDVWNLSVDLAIEVGSRIDAMEVMFAPLQDAAKAPDAAGTQALRETWSQMAEDAPFRFKHCEPWVPGGLPPGASQ